MNAPVSLGSAGLVMWWAAASASAAATPAFTVTGIIRVLNGGEMNSHAAARTSARTNAVTTTGLIGIVIVAADRDRARQSIGGAVSSGGAAGSC